MTDRLHFHFSLSCTGEGNGDPLQCSFLENPRDGGAWWAAVCGVAQGRTAQRLSSSSSINNVTLKGTREKNKQSQTSQICVNRYRLTWPTLSSTCFTLIYTNSYGSKFNDSERRDFKGWLSITLITNKSSGLPHTLSIGIILYFFMWLFDWCLSCH